MLNREIAPAYQDITGFELIQPEKITWNNGTNVFFIDGGEQDLVRIEWIFDNVLSDDENTLNNNVTCDMLLEGTRHYKHAQIVDTADFYGAYLVPQFTYDHTSFSLYSLNKHLPQLLPIVKSILTASVFPQDELDTLIRNRKQGLQLSLQKNNIVARRAFLQTLFGDNRYGIQTDIADYDNIKVSDLLEVYRKQFTSKNCTIFVSGRINDDTLNLLEEYFGVATEFAAKGIDENAYIFNNESENFVYEERPSALQSAIRVGCRTIQRSHSDFPGLQILNTILGGYFGSRLMANIREDKGYTYGINSGIVSLKHDGYFMINTEVGVEVTQATLNEISKEIEQLRSLPVSDSELAIVKNYIKGSLLGSLDNVFAHMDKFKNVYLSDVNSDYYDYYMNVVENITPSDILGFANKYYDFDNMLKVVVGKMS